MTTQVSAHTGRKARPIRRIRVVARGVVQGVGFRPFVARLADELGLAGFCGNDAVSVFVEVEGSSRSLSEFVRRLHDEAPPLAVIVDTSVTNITPRGEESFTIVESREQVGSRTLVPPDVAMCPDCAAEMADPSNRRYRHPFITCTNCGPRFTIITDLPYDRPSTTMRAFDLCAECQFEYFAPSDRRYHAQPISCHTCGPKIWWESGEDRVDGDAQVIAAAQEALGSGTIVAVKGIGGFHLACDATNDAAVALLRQRKRRPMKPFALMVPNLEAAHEIAYLDEIEEKVLSLPARPILLARAKPGSVIARSVAPGTNEVGLLLPYSPLHHLLFQQVPGDVAAAPPRCLVMTSGNLTDEPLCYRNDEAQSRLASIADAYLLHDREIAVPCEDSVVTVVDHQEVPIRRSRGYAPLPIPLPDDDGPSVLAVGAEVKNAFCITRGGFAFMSAHLGDMGSLESLEAFERSVDQLTNLHAARPEIVTADLHPSYSTRRWAEEYRRANSVELIAVQHHHAHVASLLADAGLIGSPMIGVAFDGTGYGCDRTIWGGEILVVGADVTNFERAGHLESFALPGGDAAVHNPFRVALSLLREAGLEPDLPTLESVPDWERNVAWSQLGSGVGCVRSTSVGRLFDGVASLLGICHRATYEAQAAIELEAAARSAASAFEIDVATTDGVIRLAPFVSGVVEGLRSGAPLDEIALGFHVALGRATAQAVAHVAEGSSIGRAGLTGGVFQNRILLDLVRKELDALDIEVVTHRRVPPNDGGLALGQAVVARAQARAAACSGEE